jgi:hypothetical protein
MMLATAVYEDKQDREFYFVAPNMMSAMLGETTPVILVTAMNRQKVSFLWPLKVANDNSSGNAWQESAQQGCEVAKKTWAR